MKKHAIIPIFISHRGCPNDCVFCNQRKITARRGDVKPEEARQIIETWLSTLENRNLETIEVAFFGGSFTGIPLEEQRAFLSLAQEYKTRGRIDKIHLSTRPDYIDEKILDHLKAYDVDIIELGVQSFDDEVLRRSGRGHDSAVVYQSSHLIQDYGFTLGIQLMIGLPGDTAEKDIASAEETVKIGPQLARLYPTVVITDTPLYDLYLQGLYQPLTLEEAVHRTIPMYRLLDQSGIQILRVGLKSSDIISNRSAFPAENAGQNKGEPQILLSTFHPAFRQLVESEIAREDLEKQVLALFPQIRNPWDTATLPCPTVWFISNKKSRNSLFGHNHANRTYFSRNYPRLNIRYVTDSEIGLHLADNRYLVLDESSISLPQTE